MVPPAAAGTQRQSDDALGDPLLTGSCQRRHAVDQAARAGRQTIWPLLPSTRTGMALAAHWNYGYCRCAAADCATVGRVVEGQRSTVALFTEPVAPGRDAQKQNAKPP
jgi:hypothetical protein